MKSCKSFFSGEWKIHYDIMKTSPKNGYIFPGSSSKLSYDVEFLIDWTCNFNLQYYPFGTHRYIMSKIFMWMLTCKSRCTMEFYIERKEVILQPREVSYSGLYFIIEGNVPSKDRSCWSASDFFSTNERRDFIFY